MDYKREWNRLKKLFILHADYYKKESEDQPKGQIDEIAKAKSETYRTVVRYMERAERT